MNAQQQVSSSEGNITTYLLMYYAFSYFVETF